MGRLSQAYDISTGNLWLMVLVGIAISPFSGCQAAGPGTMIDSGD
jgi:hypothetical protein